MSRTLDVGITQSEIQMLERWHLECEQRCVEMREYEMASDHKNRGRLFKALQNSGPYYALSRQSSTPTEA